MPPSGFVRRRADDYFEVFEHPELEVVLVHRSDRPAGNDELRMVAWSLENLLDPQWIGWGLVVDTRDASGTNDPRFEQELTQWCEQAGQHFRRLAILVRTNVGQRQAGRHIRYAANAIATRDEDEAIAWAATRASLD